MDTLDATSRRIVLGRVSADDFPVVPAKVVRVFLSAAGSDTLTERNILVKEAYPRLREYFRNRHGLEFQIVDLQWGQRPDEVIHDPGLQLVRRNEICKCMEVGVGPRLVIFTSQRYGRRTLPVSIDADEFYSLRVSLNLHRGRDTRNAALLDEWYVKDDNSVPPVYVLRSISEMIPDIESKDNETRTRGETTWKETERTLCVLLEKGAELSYLDGVIDSDMKEKYCMSEHETDIECGLSLCDNPSLNCVVISRNIVDLKNYITDPRAARFAEITYNDKAEQIELDDECSTRLSKLSSRIRSLISSNTLSYDVLWRYDDVINPKLHKKYLDDLRDDFCSLIVNLVELSLPNACLNMEDSTEEVYNHWSRCEQMAFDFCAQDAILLQAQNYLQGRHETPLIIHGPSGSGKTTLLSKMALMTHGILGDAALTIVRYGCLTSRSMNIQLILQSVCEQAYTCLNVDQSTRSRETLDAPNSFQQLITSFPSHLFLVIYLDDVDQVVDENLEDYLHWLPCRLPKHVKLIITTSSDSKGVLNSLETSLIQSPTSYIDLSLLTSTQCQSMFMELLNKSGKTITDEQLDAYNKTFATCPLPVFIKLLSHDAKNLKSFSGASDIQPATSVNTAMHQLFDKLELTHGKVLVSHAMALHGASGSGLSDCEMDDVLSLDEDLLNDVYEDYHPEIRRIPHSSWLRLKQDIESFMISQNIDGVTVCAWKHKMFEDVVTERYLCAEDIVEKAHSILADYFQGTWANKEKPVKAPSSSSGPVLLPCGDKADRKVPSQPLTFESLDGVVSFNRRKYDHVPRHLVLSGRLTELNKLVLFNYEWLYNKIKALSLQHILDDFALNPGEEALLVEEALRAAEPVLKRNINNLAPEITGHLLPYYSTHPHVRELLKQCDTTGLKHCALIPNFSYLQIPGGSLQYTIEPPEQVDCFRLSSDNRHLLTKRIDSSYVYSYDLETGRLSSTVFASSGELYVTPDGGYLVIVELETKKAIKIHHSHSGAYIGQIIIENHLQLKTGERCKKGPMCLTDDKLCATISTEVGYLCIANITTCQLLRIIELAGKISVCAISPNSQYVYCNSDDVLMSYDLETLESVGTLNIGVRPNAIALTNDGFRCFLSNKHERKLYNIHVDNGQFDLIYKINLEKELQNDHIEDILLSPNDELLLIRGNDTILVHDRSKEKICARLSRPPDVPKEFRLPKSHYTPLFFTQANFSADGELVIATIFRKICVWHSQTGDMVTSVDAPVGIISTLMVTSSHGKLVTHTYTSPDILVWNVHGEVNKLNTLDKLSGAIVDIQVTSANSIAYVRCKHSDEVGLIDMRSGVLLDLLTHEMKLDDFASTPSGLFLLVTMAPRLSDTATKLWDISERRIIREFGNVSGYCVPFSTNNDIIFVGQKTLFFKSPYYITLFHFIGDTFTEIEHPLALKNVRMKPFVTKDDRYLVVLTSQEYTQSVGSFVDPTVCVFDLQSGMSLACYTAETLELYSTLLDIIAIKSCLNMPSSIAVVYLCTAPVDINCNGIQDSLKTKHYGFFTLDLTTGQIDQTTGSFSCANLNWVDEAVFAKDFSFCLDKQSYIRELSTGACISCLPNPGTPPRLLALNNTVVVYFKESRLLVVRLRDGITIADCDVHGTPCNIHLCADDRTLVAGCEDGTIVSYIIIDPAEDRARDVVKSVKSRQTFEGSEDDGRLSRSWDKVDMVSCPEYSRPPSALSQGPHDQTLLKEIKALPRRRSQPNAVMYMNPNSQVCSVM